jgi:hypothetical protein
MEGVTFKPQINSKPIKKPVVEYSPQMQKGYLNNHFKAKKAPGYFE